MLQVSASQEGASSLSHIIQNSRGNPRDAAMVPPAYQTTTNYGLRFGCHVMFMMMFACIWLEQALDSNISA